MSKSLEDLLNVMKSLRDPDKGCPWDVEQDFQSIAPYTIEEAYEVVDAIENGTIDDLREELGDLLLQVVFHAQMASEAGDFDFSDVAQGVADKMISRHPHVFGDEKADKAADVNEIWDQQKDKEKKQGSSALDGVALGLPALLRAQKLQKKAARAGFEWKDAEGALVKLDEELHEFREAVAEDDLDHITEELGDVLFCLVNYARMRGINGEEALRKVNDKFIKRFKGLEGDIKVKNATVQNTSLEALLDVWKQQKYK